MCVSSEWKSLASLPVLPPHPICLPQISDSFSSMSPHCSQQTQPLSPQHCCHRLYHPALTNPHCHISSPLSSYKPHRPPLPLRRRDMGPQQGGAMEVEMAWTSPRPKGGLSGEKEAPGESYILISCHSPPPSMLSVGSQLFSFAPSPPIPCT